MADIATDYHPPATKMVHDLAIEGMTCASCVARVEKSLKRIEGVASVAVNLATESARIEAAAGVTDVALIAAVAKAGYGARPRTAAEPQAETKEISRDAAMLGIAALASAPLLLPMLSGGAIALPGGLMLALASIVQFGPGLRFYVAGWKSLRAGTGSMDVLVAIGTSAAYGLSVFDFAAQRGPLYFEASAVVITLIRLGKYLEHRAKRSAARSVGALASLRPDIAHRVTRDGVADLAVAALSPGDVIEVRPGERVPADARINDGAGLFDEQHITGEALPVLREAGATVMAGALAQDTALRLTVVAEPGQSMIDRMARLIEDAQASKPPIQRLADTIAAWFVPVILLIALATLAGWLLAGAATSTAVIAAVSVLVIACPCALGLATPAAIVTGTGVAARHGILIRDAVVLEAAHRVDTVVFDKTGTLTEGKPELVAVQPMPGIAESWIRALASALSATGTHPLARALRDALPDAAPAEQVSVIAGRGVRGTVEGEILLLGNARLATETGADTAALAALTAKIERDGTTLSFLLRENGTLLGVLVFADTARLHARDAVVAVRALGCTVMLLTGDNQGAARALARDLGLDDVIAEADPIRKRAEIKALRDRGRVVAMVGDGINDAAALAEADLGIAIGSGVDTALDAAPIVLLRDDPRLVADALALARRVRRTLWQGLFWAFIYNVIGIPLAAFGLLNPMVSGAAMAASSVSVLGNALLLRRWRGQAS
ncbi:cation-translocating P-type ATPase [Acidiphilium sp. AL]|uniref:Cation-translocating P-type ATPase n=1 Tax=Acidiphilium iwatense TaxID=768198 RepID=A0ABS9DVR0_9PROT|nr:MULTISPECIES: cation-translocating P-type ATPase [Acidiphilium]MCF3946819.1 cation-translocating P-type ATPase [Acidiphilium iwatense]MCU4160848.1 cation-translocating P-type ATPase [Acidiphilium sp. AL]